MDIKTKCRIAKGLKKWGPHLITAMGFWTMIELILRFPAIKNEILMLINGSKCFLQISWDTQRFLIVIILLFFGILLYFTGRKLYKKWICWRFEGGN